MAEYTFFSPSEAFKYQFKVEAAQLRMALPGIIETFDPATQIATVRPACRMKVNVGDGVKYVDMPVLKHVPVVLPFSQGAGLLLTLPIQPKDECLIIFADRAIDDFVTYGGIQNSETSVQPDVSIPRIHHLTDAICIPGIISMPQAVPGYSTSHIELRDRERKNFLSLGPSGITPHRKCGSRVAEGRGSQVTLHQISEPRVPLGGLRDTSIPRPDRECPPGRRADRHTKRTGWLPGTCPGVKSP